MEDQNIPEPVTLNTIRKPEPMVPTDVLKDQAEKDSDAVKLAFQKVLDLVNELNPGFSEGSNKACMDWRNLHHYLTNELRFRIERGH